VAPFSIRNGEPVVPFDFHFQAHFDRGKKEPRLLAKGRQDQANHRLEIDLRVVAVDMPTVNRFLEKGVALDATLAEVGQAARDWILAGSFSTRLQGEFTPEKAKGELTLRVREPRFGPNLKSQELVGQKLGPFLEALERRTDTIQLGPMPFEEDLKTPDRDEAFEQLQVALAAELIRAAPDAAIRAGAGILKNLLKKE